MGGGGLIQTGGKGQLFVIAPSIYGALSHHLINRMRKWRLGKSQVRGEAGKNSAFTMQGQIDSVRGPPELPHNLNSLLRGLVSERERDIQR